MVTTPQDSFIATLKSEIADIEHELEDTEREYERVAQHILRLRADREAVLRVLTRVSPETVADEEMRSQSESTEVSRSEQAPSAKGPTAIAVELAQEAGGIIEVSELGRVLHETRPYKDRSSAYASAYATLGQSPRFMKVGTGLFRLRQPAEEGAS